MKTFVDLTRTLAIETVIEGVKTAFACYWLVLKHSLDREGQRLLRELQTEIDGTLLPRARMELEQRSTPELCRMTDQSIAAFADFYLDRLAEKVETLFQ